ncbi:MAG: GtrA family protein [Thomasclavelia spiroformis]
MFSLYKKYKEIIMYLIFGILTTVVNIVVYFIASNILNINYLISNATAWFLSVLFAYVTNKLYVFESSSKEFIKEIVAFFSSRLATGILDMFLMWLFVTVASLNDVVVKIFVNILVIIMNYIFSKLFVFRKDDRV